MKRVKTCTNLHALNLVYCLLICEDDANLLKSWSSVRELVLDDEILALLCVYKWGNPSLLGSNNWLKLLNSILFKNLINRIVWSWCDLVDHRPREAHLALVFNVCKESRLYLTVNCPFFCKRVNSVIKLVSVV